MIAILILTAALCASLTLFIQQAASIAGMDAGGGISVTKGEQGKGHSRAGNTHANDGSGAPSPKAPAAQQSPSAPSSGMPANELPPGTVDLNAADAGQLESIKGIGPVTARKIIEYRSKIGRFSSTDQLLQVGGIGPKTLEKIRPKLVVQ
ncbi:ComEA family DNA-binding protein [Bifidobacterium xylocopae]|uniref:ComEA family DNA-binding protein n=1 Tax=Bifidobacterium xylocopae TaxID=2493119 RepID=UPI00137529FD|nr:helix-hairpin-helix domain-containing protein [Bifidobacterium xylocopae]